MANTIRVKVIHCRAEGHIFVMMPGSKYEAVIAPDSFGKHEINMIGNDLLDRIKGNPEPLFTLVNLNNQFNQRQLKHRKVQKFFVDVKINTH